MDADEVLMARVGEAEPPTIEACLTVTPALAITADVGSTVSSSDHDAVGIDASADGCPVITCISTAMCG